MLRDPAFFRRPNNIASRGRGGGKNRWATKFRKNAPKYAILSTVLSKIVAFCLPRRSRGKWKKDDANIQSSWPAWSIKDLVTVLSSYRGFCSQRPVFILLLFSILRVGRQPMQDTDLSRFFKAKRYHGSLRDTIAHLLQTHLRRLGTRRII